MTRNKWCSCVKEHVGRDSIVGTATRYELDRSGFETQWERDFSHPCRLVAGPTDSRTMGTVFLSRA
jgi:hypothetical protein